jgi:hypothetical protein
VSGGASDYIDVRQWLDRATDGRQALEIRPEWLQDALRAYLDAQRVACDRWQAAVEEASRAYSHALRDAAGELDREIAKHTAKKARARHTAKKTRTAGGVQ